MKKSIKIWIGLLLLSIGLEFGVWNYRALISQNASEQSLEVTRGENGFYLTGMTGKPHYLYLNLADKENGDREQIVRLTIYIRDEGSDHPYELEPVYINTRVRKSAYLSLHSYGSVKQLYLAMDEGVSRGLELKEAVFDARVPWFISLSRILLVWMFCLGVWHLKALLASGRREPSKWCKRGILAGWIVANGLLFLVMVRSNPAFINPIWPYHRQYQELAQSLTRGKLSIDVGDEEILRGLDQLDNPYDTGQRMERVPGVDRVWDTAYYEGKFYVYFGLVPVLLFYLPYRLICHQDFPTWLGVLAAGLVVLGGVYYFLSRVRKAYFPGTPFWWYIVGCLIMGNSMHLSCALLHADFYYLPLVTALALSLWGLGLVLEAARRWKKGERGVAWHLAPGAFLLALTAGSRPQFLVGSFFLIPLLLPLFWKKQEGAAARWKRLGRGVALVVPYVSVAACLMYYNYARFGSVVDFGANYNLTTNDMTRRGLEWGRIPDGIFMYLFQPPVIKLTFPFAEVTPFYTGYLGETVKDWTFGGAIWTHSILLGLVAVVAMKKKLKEKGLYGLCLLSMALAVLVVVADTQMAGIMNRYYMDFMWLLLIPAMVGLFQMLETCQGTRAYTWMMSFILVAGGMGIFYEWGIALRSSGLINDNPHAYYILWSLFH